MTSAIEIHTHLLELQAEAGDGFVRRPART